jgi:two-component system phosphate regulon sensor histidine kinase PhoR
MGWFLFWAILAVAIAFAIFVWRKWIAPWRPIQQLADQVARGESPRTFLVNGGTESQRVGFALERIFAHLEEVNRAAAGRESGTQTILRAMQDGLLVVDAHRRVILANRAFRRLFDLRQIAAGEPLLDILRNPAVEQLIHDALHSPKWERTELSMDDRDLEISAVPIRNDADGVTGAVVLFHDITQLKRADKVRRDFVANVSHELRTPLSILRGYIETLLDQPETSRAELVRILEVMERHSNRLGLLVEDLLTLAQLESATPNLQLSDVNLEELLQNVIRDWEKKFVEKKLQVTVDVASDSGIVLADETRLQEVLYNLLDNAVKYSRENGQIDFEVQRWNGEVAVSVTDDGIGISKSDLPRIFERFYRADKARSRELGGTGLGLAIVKHIAQLHGGRVEAESELGQGTTIRIILPTRAEDQVRDSGVNRL